MNRKANMKKLIFAVIVLSIGYFTIAKAEETKSITPQEFVDRIASVPGKQRTGQMPRHNGRDFYQNSKPTRLEQDGRGTSTPPGPS